MKIVNKVWKFYLKYKTYFNVFIFFWAIFALSNSGFDTSEGEFHYQVAEQIVKYGKLGFDTDRAGIFITAPNGRTYGSHEIGNTLFLLPTAFVNTLIENTFSNFISQETINRIQQFVLSFQAGTYTAISAAIFFFIVNQLFLQTKINSFIATLLLIYTTYLWTYARNLFDGVLCTTILLLSFAFLVTYKQKSKLTYLTLCFICLGFALITRLSTVLAILASISYLLSVNRPLDKRFREALTIIVTLIPFIAWQFWYNNLRTGIFYKSPVQTPVYAENNGLDGNILVGIQGLLLSPGKSIFIYAPLLILSIFLYKKFYQKHQKEAIYVAAISILWLLLHAKLKSWYGAWGWGPRHFVTILPSMFLPLAVNLEYVLKKTILKIAAIILGSFGFLLALSSIISNWQFRMEYAKQRGLLGDEVFIWSLGNSQPIDMLKGAFDNVTRLITHAPAIVIKDSYSPANEYASSTINVWYNSFVYAGMPWYIVFILVVPLLILIYLSIQNIFMVEDAKSLPKS